MLRSLMLVFLLFAVACDKDTTNPDGLVSDFINTTPATNGDPNDYDNPGTDGTPTGPSQNQSFTQQFMTLVNNHRVSIGLKILTHDDDLAEIAIEHSENMANASVAFGHTGFSDRCSRARSAIGGGNWCGENVATGQKTPQAAFTAWMNSSGHRANIEQAKATQTGFGYARSNSGTYYWTQIFVQYQ